MEEEIGPHVIKKPPSAKDVRKEGSGIVYSVFALFVNLSNTADKKIRTLTVR
jgi:hypothetical protein